ncbi:MAG: hypothetical protein JWP63_4352 [Candidatus Solibacter sp.]|jgi:hypothetical protein|nr:hypothetical protein [Candidatus Solibacter sp.]
MRVHPALLAVTVLGSLFQVPGQERRESRGPAVYKVEFDIRDGLDGTAQTSQHYSMLIDESRKGVFQAGNRVPVVPGSTRYIDVGVTINCAVHEADGKAALNGDIELTNITGQVSTGISQPIIGQRIMTFHRDVNLGAPTVIADTRRPLTPLASTAGGRQVEATVTRVN